MGWTGLKSKKSFKKVFEDEFIQWKVENKIVKSAFIEVQKEWRDHPDEEENEQYIALRCKNNLIGCIVILWKRIDNEVLYKVMDETVGPSCKTKCPKDILDLLSPLDEFDFNGYAETFRKIHSQNSSS